MAVVPDGAEQGLAPDHDGESSDLLTDEGHWREWSRQRSVPLGHVLAYTVSVSALVVIAALGGYMLGHGTGADLDAARTSGKAVAEATANDEGVKAYQRAFEEGRDVGYGRAFGQARDRAYDKRMRKAGFKP